MPTYKAPGVYVEEISIFPPSVAEVETAIPAFVGYTERAESNGEVLIDKPTKVSSLLEYQQLFGGAYEVEDIDVTVDPANNYAVDSVEVPNRFYMYDALRLFFDNGGGDCYVVSAGLYEDAAQNGVDVADLQDALAQVRKYDEPTLLLFPDAVLLTDKNQFYTLQQRALGQAADLQDRFSILDLRENDDNIGTWEEVYEDFRDNIGINNLKYGAAYTPWLVSSYPKEVSYELLLTWDDATKTYSSDIIDTADDPVPLDTLTSDPRLNELTTTALQTRKDLKILQSDLEELRTNNAMTLADRYKQLRTALREADPTDDAAVRAAFQNLLALVRDTALRTATWKTGLTGSNLQKDIDTYAQDELQEAVEALIALEKNDQAQTVSGRNDGEVDTDYGGGFDPTGWLSDDVGNISGSGTSYTGGNLLETALNVVAHADPNLDTLFGYAEAREEPQILSFVSQVREAAETHAGLAQRTLYQEHPVIRNIVAHVQRELSVVPPSGAIAGVYAQVDNARGVWKAPANVSLNSIVGSTEHVDRFGQEDLNVDPNAGKSINAIRAFSGKGTLVWGARTLAGNDNEWRYVPVRRFFNMVEESIMKSTGWAVFEPNDANTWTKVQSMIQNYLIQKWRDGALVGATPDEAFFVKVGLGQTMTPQDVLEGLMKVEIGMAVVRPAEFIILKFSHKLQEA